MKDWIVTFRTKEAFPVTKRTAVKANSILDVALLASDDDFLKMFDVIKIEVLE